MLYDLVFEQLSVQTHLAVQPSRRALRYRVVRVQ